ncbi:hypothetical protein PTT_09431 [Pyrenophora teres f. teres 0-1]|uniref:DUF6604 domain-containing protein n=1 Tax=Pyrenophora teres f. teres (strain 0-1) TaxID=861557 RepID=E3RM02_PYRTT|nr:hypothetical protein PTT_09431 [Pyrenophora teres f. teres 0-1]
MAEAIANHSPRITVPGALTKLFERVIEARKKAAAWISASRNKHQQPIEQSNQTHAHFIDILSNAAQILQPLVRERPRQASGPSQRHQGSHLDSTRDMTNTFSGLAVDGDNVPDDAEEENEPATRKEDPLDSLPPVNPVEVYQDESEIEAEFFFAIQSFLSNLHELRDIVQQTWWDYKNDRLDMVHASIIANTAIDLVRHAESEFELTLKRPKNYPSKRFPVRVLPALLLSTQHGDNLHGKDDLHDFLFPSGLMMPGAHDCSQVYWCLWPVYSGLKYYLEDAFKPVGGVHKDTMRTVKLCTTFRHFTKKHHDTIAIDEVTRGMEHMFKHNEVPLWTTFGMQLLLDIQDAIGEGDAYKPLCELQERLDREISYNEAFTSKSSPFSDARVEELRGDMTHNLKYNQELAKDSCDTLKPNPIRCGLLMYDAYLELNTIGHTLERVAGEMCMMAHLYKATRLIAPDSPTWPDMEYLIYQQDENHLFFGGVPKTFEECVRKVKLMMGQSRADQAREERMSEKSKKAARGRPLKPKNGRWIQDPSILAPIFRERSLGRRQTLRPLIPKKLRITPEQLDAKFDSERLGRCEYHPGSDNGPTTLLRDLSSWLEGDATDLYFSWQALQDQCGKIWSRIVNSFSKDPKWDRKKSLTPYMGVCILEEAAADEHHWETIAKDDPKFAIHLRKVHIAIQATIFEKIQPPQTNLGIFAMEPQTTKHLARGGDVCLSRMATDSKIFFHSFRPSNFEHLYANWPENVVIDTKILWAWEEHTKAVMLRCWGVIPGRLSHMEDDDHDHNHNHTQHDDNKDDDDDYDPELARRIMEFNAEAKLAFFT